VSLILLILSNTRYFLDVDTAYTKLYGAFWGVDTAYTKQYAGVPVCRLYYAVRRNFCWSIMLRLSNMHCFRGSILFILDSISVGRYCLY